ncbi:MAG TPA: hypothetical protein P5165_00155 [Spirochaetia bacterium]|nr:hypothetical protein [Spirochaetia bacterium]
MTSFPRREARGGRARTRESAPRDSVPRDFVPAAACLVLAFLLSARSLPAQSFLERVSTRFVADAQVPVLGDEATFDTGYRAGVEAEFRALPFLAPYLRAGAGSAPLAGEGLGSVSLADGGLGLALSLRAGERLALRLSGEGGLYRAAWNDAAASGVSYGLRAELGFRLSPAFSLSAAAGLTRYEGASEPLLSAATAGLVFGIKPAELGNRASKVRALPGKLEPVFPVFHSYYDGHSFGTVRVENGEDYELKDLKVSFVSSRYMSRPKLCATIESLPPGEAVEVPLYALFDDDVLSLTEGTLLSCEAVVDYRAVGSRREIRAPLELRLHHRNAMNWDDDRRAAAFASPKDPAALWFSRYASAVARDRLRGDVDPNLQQAASVFEALKLFGINYVVDPSSSYVEKSSSESSVDYLQYPYQTLSYRGGDCDDLSILNASLLSSLGIETAFITIPGHIYMAFALRMGEAEARASFYDPGLLIYRDGKAWVPVEITMVKDGFVKAWRIGAKEWADNERQGEARLYPLPEAWRLYPPVGLPDVNPRFSLPDEALAMQAFDMAMDRFVAREIEPQVRALAGAPGSEPGPAARNELGILYGRYGMLKEAWREFSASAKGGSKSAWTNLGNVAFIRKDYALALEYYGWALGLEPGDSLALLGKARASYELERFDASGEAYRALKAADPALAARYGYLGSLYGGEGRAWSLSERLSSTAWARPAAAASAAVAPAAVAPAVAAPASAAAAPIVEASPSAPAVAAPATPAAAAPALVPETVAAAAPEAAAAPSADAATLPGEPLLAESAPPAGAEAAAPILDEPAPPQVPSSVASTEPALAEPVAAPVAPPAIAEALPEDRDAAMAAEEAARRLAALRAEEEGRAAAEAERRLAEARAAETARLAAEEEERKLAEARADEQRLRETEAASLAAEEEERKLAEARTAEERLREAAAAAAPPSAPAEAAQSGPATQPESAPAAPPPISEDLPEDRDAALAAEEAARRLAVSRAEEEARAAEEAERRLAEERAAEERLREAEERLREAEAARLAAAEAEPVREEVIVEEAPQPAGTIAEAAPSPTVETTSPAPNHPIATEPAVAPAALEESAADGALTQAGDVADVGSGESPEAVRVPLLSGFEGFVPGLGEWIIGESVAAQGDPESYYAKLARPLASGEGALRYSFTARSTGRGWTGYGLHVLVAGARTHRGYGEGESYLVWVMRDPRRGDGSTRLELYRSRTDVDMGLVGSVPLPGSIFESARIEVEADPLAGSLVVRVDGVERLREAGLSLSRASGAVVLRALDRAEFSDFSVEAIP